MTATPPSPSLALRAAHDIVTARQALHLDARDVALLLLLKDDLQRRTSSSFVVNVDDIRALSSKIDAFEGSPSSHAERRVTESIERLLQAECLVRADMRRLRDADHAEYQLTEIGEAIAQWKLAQTRLDAEPLTAILSAFNVQLASIHEAAQAAGSDGPLWKKDVDRPLRFVVRELLTSVQRHQRALDRAHNEVRHQIPLLLKQSSEQAIDGCRTLVDHVMKTIQDLFAVTFDISHAAFGVLDRVEELAGERGQDEIARACEDARLRLESVMDWTTSRQGDWGRHFDSVHRHLRFVAMVDRSRRVTEALKNAVSAPPTWSLEVADAPRMLALRSAAVAAQPRPAVRRPRSDFVQTLEEVAPDELPALLERLANEQLAAGSCRWTDVVAQALEFAPSGPVLARLPDVMKHLVSNGKVGEDRSLVELTASCVVEQLEVTR